MLKTMFSFIAHTSKIMAESANSITGFTSVANKFGGQRTSFNSTLTITSKNTTKFTSSNTNCTSNITCKFQWQQHSNKILKKKRCRVYKRSKAT